MRTAIALKSAQCARTYRSCRTVLFIACHQSGIIGLVLTRIFKHTQSINMSLHPRQTDLVVHPENPHDIMTQTPPNTWASHYRFLSQNDIQVSEGNTDDPLPRNTTALLKPHGQPARPVALKHLSRDLSSEAQEIHLMEYFNDISRRCERENHCVESRLLESTAPDQRIFLVMQRLQDFDEPPFITVGEVVDFVRQVLEGLFYIHRHRVVYGFPYKEKSIGMDAAPLYKDSDMQQLNDQHLRPCTTRTRAPRKVQYYFRDLGMAYKLPDDTDAQYPWTPQDDIKCLGEIIDHSLLKKYTNLAFMEDLVRGMEEPGGISTAEAAVRRFEAVILARPEAELRSRLRKKNEFWVKGLYRNLKHYFRKRKDERYAAIPSLVPHHSQ
ncbi:hypothetical protein BXZ70DRAFT_12319 [Cristinia sonorae]|uniref:Protein kinase domain-containing protein n=1 Tax=Cristinia sonorae TaxID=1940300 RepID=A0A8K0XUL0_9AGAR|nr:hypothetical protein BXZ70DRAFT_12319 [Cristinia sonorae]